MSCYIGRNINFGPFVAKGVINLLEGAEAHKVALVTTAGAIVGRNRNEVLFGTFLLHFVKNATFCYHQEGVARRCYGIVE